MIYHQYIIIIIARKVFFAHFCRNYSLSTFKATNYTESLYSETCIHWASCRIQRCLALNLAVGQKWLLSIKTITITAKICMAESTALENNISQTEKLRLANTV